MIVRRIAAPLAALMISSTLLAGAGPAFAARGEDSGSETEAEAEAAEAEEAEQKPCPEELWTVPVQVEGLACVLLLQKDDKKADEEDEKPKKKGGGR